MSDVVVTLLPIPVLCTLNLRLEKKIGLAGSFALGLFTTLCSVLRYTQIKRIQFGDGNSTLLVVWGVIEFHIGTIVSSLPFLAPACLRCCQSYGSKRSGYESGFRSGGQGRGGGAEGDGRSANAQGHFVCAEAAPPAEDGGPRGRGSILVRESVSVHSSRDERACAAKTTEASQSQPRCVGVDSVGCSQLAVLYYETENHN